MLDCEGLFWHVVGEQDAVFLFPEGVAVLPNTTLEKAEYKNGKVCVTTSSGQEVGHVTGSSHMCEHASCTLPMIHAS